MAIKSFKRYEKKYLLNQSQYDELIKRISEYMDADEHCKNGNNYSIYNIYYDTLEFYIFLYLYIGNKFFK